MRLLVLLLVLLFAPLASAFPHVPYIEGCDFAEGEAYMVVHPVEKSVAVYAHFSDEYDVDMAVFNLLHGDEVKLHLGSLVPKCSLYEDVRPSIAVVGPLQEYLPPYDGDDLPFEVAEWEGVYLIVNEEQGEEFYEPIGGKSYWRQERHDIWLNEAGEYRIYYWEPNGYVADYVMEIGDVEIWGWREIVQAIRRTWVIIHDLEIHDPICRAEL